MTTIEERIAKLEADLKVVASVTSAAVDDTLRVCFVLRELETNGYLPSLPWDLATKLVDLEHARQAQLQGEVKKGSPPIEIRIAELESEIQKLREAFVQKANEQAGI